MVYVPPPFAADSILEAIDAEIELTLRLPKVFGSRHGAGEAGAAGQQVAAYRPQLPRRSHADECKIGIMPGSIFKKGSVGVVSRSGTLTYEAVHQTTAVGLGQTRRSALAVIR